MGGHRFVIVHTAGKINICRQSSVSGAMEFFAHFETEKLAGPGRMPRTGSGHEPCEVNIGGKADFDGSGSKNDFGP